MTGTETRRDRRTAADLIRLCLWTFVIGVATGLFAALLVYMLHGIENLVYGQHEGDVPVVTDGTTGLQRFLGITVAGLIAAPAWWAVRRLGRPIKSVEEGMSGARVPVLETLINVFLQMGTVAAGASVGRENGPCIATDPRAPHPAVRPPGGAHLRNLLVVLSARTLPSVWQVAQYATS